MVGGCHLSKWNKLKKDIVKSRQLYFMALPVMLFYIIFRYGSMYGGLIAFMDFKPAKGFLGSDWVGLKHFIRFLSDPYFFRLIRNTLLISIYSIIFSMPAAIILALLLNEIRNMRFKRLVQTVSYLPHFVSMVVICGMLKNFLSSDGIITTLLSYLGFPQKNLLMVPAYYRAIHVASGIWQTVGWNSIIYLSALAGIDQEQYEAADLDGAGRLQKMCYITLPGILPTITVMFIIRLGQVMSVGYEKILLLSNTANLETADVISSYVYRMGIASSYPQYSYSAAVGLFTSVINLILVTLGNKICKKLNGSGLW